MRSTKNNFLYANPKGQHTFCKKLKNNRGFPPAVYGSRQWQLLLTCKSFETNVKIMGWGREKCQLEQGKSQSNLSPSCLSPKGRGMGNERRHQNKLCVLYCSCTVRLWISHQSQSSQPFTLLALLLGAHKQKPDMEFTKKRHYARAVHGQREKIHRLLEVNTAKHIC